MSNLRSALETFKLETGRYPITAEGLEALVTAPPNLPGWHSYLDRVPTDKWGTPYTYLSPGIRHPTSFDLTSAGEDRTFGTPDDLALPPP